MEMHPVGVDVRIDPHRVSGANTPGIHGFPGYFSLNVNISLVEGF